MRDVIAAMLDNTPTYGPRPAEGTMGKARRANWKDWLDAVDELGLVPTGETDMGIAEQALKDMGIASGKQLKGRQAARTAYHEALAGMDGAHLPKFVNAAMEKWDFKTAVKAIPVAIATYGAIADNEVITPEAQKAFMEDFDATRSLDSLRKLKQRATDFQPTETEGTDVPTDA